MRQIDKSFPRFDTTDSSFFAQQKKGECMVKQAKKARIWVGYKIIKAGIFQRRP